jgi:hypothetical protein
MRVLPNHQRGVFSATPAQQKIVPSKSASSRSTKETGRLEKAAFSTVFVLPPALLAVPLRATVATAPGWLADASRTLPALVPEGAASALQRFWYGWKM